MHRLRLCVTWWPYGQDNFMSDQQKNTLAAFLEKETFFLGDGRGVQCLTITDWQQTVVFKTFSFISVTVIL